jgi:hypothetical protein
VLERARARETGREDSERERERERESYSGHGIAKTELRERIESGERGRERRQKAESNTDRGFIGLYHSSSLMSRQQNQNSKTEEKT